MNYQKLVLITCLLWSSVVFSQSKWSVSGIIKDKKSGEVLMSTFIYDQAANKVLGKSNEYGFYSITLPSGRYQIKVKMIGYKESILDIFLDSNMKMNIELESSTTLKETIIRSKRKAENIDRAVMGTEDLNLKEVSKIPVLLGEKDVLKTIQLLPGVKPSSEGSSGFHVRGGSTDQNLVLLDEAVVYNASHVLGLFSTFNSDALKDVSLIKGSSPSNYGGRLSSVLDVRMKDGNNKKISASGGIGLISSRLTYEMPIIKDKASLLISGRRSYIDLFLKLSDEYKDNKMYFYDLNLKSSFKINEKNKIYLSGYFGRDELGLGENFGFNWGNSTATIRWNNQINNKWFSNTSFIMSNYDYNVNIKNAITNNLLNINSKIADLNLKQDMHYFHNPDLSSKFGFSSIYHRFKPLAYQGDSIDFFKKDKKGFENAIYITGNYRITPKLVMELGIRTSFFTILGGDMHYLFENSIKKDSIDLTNSSFGKTYINIEPRATFNYNLNEFSSIKLGYARNAQYVNLVNNSALSNPTEFWIPASYNVKPQLSDQVSLGYSRLVMNNNYEINIETYYKHMQNQIDFKNSADIYTSENVESELLYGIGRAYGLEVSIKKKLGNLTGWISYTLSKTERKVEGINDNEWYSARQDRTHDLSIVASYQISQRWSVSSAFVYSTGDAVTFPSGKYTSGGVTQYYYKGRNNERMPDFHRWDISATLEGKENKKFQSSWNFGLYNVYGRENAYLINFKEEANNPNITKVVQTSLFRWIPSVTYNFKF